MRIVPGTGEWKINGRSLEEYFPNKVHQQLIKEPLVTLEKEETYDVFATLTGGGVTGQAGALRLGLSDADRAELDAAIKEVGAQMKDGTGNPRIADIDVSIQLNHALMQDLDVHLRPDG